MEEKQNAVAIAIRLLTASPGAFEPIQVRSFDDPIDAHNDAMQGAIRREFNAAFEEAVKQLSSEFGPPIRSSEEEDDIVPLCEVFRLAVWDREGRELFLAAAHEDREMPHLLVVGIA